MSLDYGLVLQIHVGSVRNYSSDIMARFGRDKGYDIPTQTDYVTALKPLLNAVGGEASLTIITFTLDQTSFARGLAPLAGVYPALKLGPPWWFYNTVEFNDDTRAFCSIPAHHDVARHVDCAYLATLVATGRLAEDEAAQVAYDLTYRL